MRQETRLEDAVRELQAVHEIMNLEADYAYATDTHDADLYASVFTKDGVMDFGDLGLRAQGRENLKKLCSVMHMGFSFAMHCMHNPHIVVNGDTAEGRFYWEAALTWALTNEPVLASGRSFEKFARTDEGWKIKEKLTTWNYFTRFDQGWVKEPMMEVGDLMGMVPDLLGGDFLKE